MRVWNDRGEVRAVCAISDRVRPGVAWMPFGGFLDAGGSRRSVNALTAEEPTDWGGGSGLYDAFVEVAPADLSSSFPSATRDGSSPPQPSGLPEPAGRFHRGATRGELDSIINGRVEDAKA